MTGVITLLDQPRTLNALGKPTSAIIFFYEAGTTILAPIYDDESLTIPASNPVIMAAGEIFPDIYLDDNIKYRRRIIYGDGTIHDVDPFPVAGDNSEFAEFIVKEDKRNFHRLSIRADFNGVGDGVASDIAAFNACIDYINANGSTDPMVGDVFTVDIGPGKWNLRASGLNPVLVSNVTFASDPTAEILVENGKTFQLGRKGGAGDAFVENIHFTSPRFVCPLPFTPAIGQACVFIDHGARIFLENPMMFRTGSLLAADIKAGAIVVSVTVRNPSGNSMPGFDVISIKNVNGGSGAGIFLEGGGGFMYAPPTNPNIVPFSVTGITNANPGVVTIAGHGLTTGDKVRFFRLAGMTALNGQDCTVTVLTPNTFSIGVNTTAYGSYTPSSGYCSELHFSNGVTSSVLSIEGAWDTAVVTDGLWQHYRYFCKLKSNGLGGAPISFVNLSPKYWDYGGADFLNIDLAGASISQVKMWDVWHFALEGPMINVSSSGGGRVIGMDVKRVYCGLAGERLIKGTIFIDNLSVNDVGIGALHRTDPDSTTYSIALDGTANQTVQNVFWPFLPSSIYGGGSVADDTLISAVAWYSPNGANSVTVRNCDWRARLTEGGSVRGAGIDRISGSKVTGPSGGTPILSPSTLTVGASPWTWVNNTGTPAYFKVTGGTVSDITLGGGEAPDTGTSLASATNALILVGAGQPITVTYSVLPTIVAQPVKI